jgi:hypothetical protein
MSTLYRAERRWQKYAGAGTSESPFFCRIHLSAFLKWRVKGFDQNFGLSEKFRKYFGKTALFRNNFGLFFLNGGAYGA